MVPETNKELTQLLWEKIIQEEERYLNAIKEEVGVWELKQIRSKITDLQKYVIEISTNNEEKESVSGTRKKF